jgi:uracil phosphoribosyltransferase
LNILKKVKVPIGVNVYRVDHPRLPRNSYILCIPQARKILYNPVICGGRLRELAVECNKAFLKAALHLVPGFKELRANEVAEIVVLRGGLGYSIDVAFKELFGGYLPRCFIGARRFRISREEFGAEISYCNFDPLPDDGVLLMGDTIATGASLAQTLGEVEKELLRRNRGVKKLLVFSIAAAFRGCVRLLEWEERFRERWPNFRIYLFAAEALFGLDEGTHLRFRKEGEAILPEETKAYVSRVYGDYETAFLPGNICAIFDWGDRIFRLREHLEDVMKFARSSLKVAKDKKSREVLRRMEKEAKLELRKLGRRLAMVSRF